MKSAHNSPPVVDLLPEPTKRTLLCSMQDVPLFQGIAFAREELENDELREIGSRLDALADASDDSTKYTQEIDPRFETNLDFIRSAGKIDKGRDFVFLEIYKTRQWRNRYRSLEHFIETETGITRGTFHKAVDKAEIKIQLLRAGIEAMPTVRQFEQLARVEKNHRVEAWKLALRLFAQAGCSESVARYAFIRYCHENDVCFGRLKFGRKMSEFDLLAAKARMDSASAKKVGDDGNWADRVAPEVVQAISESMPAGIRERMSGEKDPNACGIEFIHALQDLAGQEPNWSLEHQQMHCVLHRLKTCEPAIGDALMRIAINGLVNFLEGEIMLRMRDSRGMQRKAG